MTRLFERYEGADGKEYHVGDNEESPFKCAVDVGIKRKFFWYTLAEEKGPQGSDDAKTQEPPRVGVHGYVAGGGFHSLRSSVAKLIENDVEAKNACLRALEWELNSLETDVGTSEWSPIEVELRVRRGVGKKAREKERERGRERGRERVREREEEREGEREEERKERKETKETKQKKRDKREKQCKKKVKKEKKEKMRKKRKQEKKKEAKEAKEAKDKKEEKG